MDRRLTSGVGTALAMISIFSCSDGPTGVNNFNSDDLSADASRVSTVTVSFSTTSIAIGDTTRAAAVLKDYRGQVLQRSVTWGSSNSAVASVDTTGLVRGIAPGSAVITAVRGFKSGSASIDVVPVVSTQTTKPGTVTDLKVTAADSNSVTLSFTQVNDGTGQPAQYDVRYATPPIAWGSATSATAGTCRTPIAGTAIGTALACTVQGLQRSSNYNFQLIAFRGTLNLNAVFGSLSNVVSATTTGSAPPPPVPVASVTVSPSSVSLPVGATSQLTATLRDANNNVLTGRTVTWSSASVGIASINTSGVVTGVLAGSAQVTATSEGKSGSATVTVSAPAPPPPPPPSGSVEPAGFTTLTERGFGALNEDGWTNTGSSSYSIQVDATAPKSPSTVGQIKFPKGFGSGNAPAVLEKVWTSGIKTLYVSFWLKLSSNWVGNDATVNKIFHFWIGDSNRLFLNAHGAGTSKLTAEVWLQGITAGGNYDGGKTANFGPNQGVSGELVRGKWAHWEMVFTGNSSGAKDGKVEWWIDGQKVGSYSGIQFVPGAGTWQEMEWSPTYGGFGSAVPADQFMSVDHIRISGSK